MRVNVALLAILFFFGCATERVPDSPYNKGVEAYRTKNYSEAAAQWTIAAEAGEVSAKNNLAFLLFNGLGVEQQQDQALALWRSAAMQGHAESQWHLGGAYENGQSVKQDRALAYAWYRCAIASAELHLKAGPDPTEEAIADDARKSVINLTDRLAPTELQRGQLFADELITKYAVDVP